MMMMGKHGRPAYRRTSSMTGITLNLGVYNNSMDTTAPPPPPPENQRTMMIGGEYDHHMMSLSPRYNVNNSSYVVVETAEFLRSCGLCNRRLAPGRDIYMYRGDAAFCSLECREQQIKQDERNERREAAKTAIISAEKWGLPPLKPPERVGLWRQLDCMYNGFICNYKSCMGLIL